MSKEKLVKEIIRTKLSEAGMSSKFRKAAEEYKEVSLKLQNLYADRAKALEGYKKADGAEKEKYKNELSRIQKLVSPLQDQMEKAERVFNKALLSEPEELEEAKAMDMSEDETLGVAETLAKAISKIDGVKCTVDMKTIEPAHFDLVMVVNGKKEEAGTFNIHSDGSVRNEAIGGVKYGTVDSSVSEFIRNLKRMSETVDKDGMERVAAGLPQTEEEPVTEATADVIAKDLDKVRGELLKKVSDLVAKKKKLYSNVDISSPMSAEEKKLDKEIADAFSQINQLVKQRRDMKTETVSEAKFNHINTGEKTINKKVMDKVKETFPMMKSVKKKNVPNMGEVLYIHDGAGNGIGQVYVDKQHGAVIDVKEGVSEALKPVNEWKLQLDLGKVNPSQFEDWASDSFQKKHKIKVSGSDKNWTIVGNGNDDRTGSSADWITRLLGKAWTTNKIKVVQKESISEGKNDKKIKELEAKLAKVKGKTPGDEGIRAAIRDDIERLKTEGLSEALNPATGEWILFKVISPVSVKKKFMSTHKSHRSAQIAMKKALDKMNINDEFDGYGIMSKDKWDKEDSRFKVESVNEEVGKEAMGIASITATRRDAVQKFIDDNNLDGKKLFNHIKGGKLSDRMDFVTALSGKADNKFHKMIVSKFGLKESVSEGKKFGSKYDIGMGRMGSGVTVWNRLQKQGGDYKTIAHISDAGKVSFRDKSLPDDVKKYIEDYAKKGMNEMVNEASKRANDVFGDSKHGQEIHKMLKGKWDAKKVDDYLEELGGGSIQKNLRIIDFITKEAGLNPRTYDTKTLGKQISDLIDKLEVLYKDFTQGTDLKKFDDVRIKSKNLTGMVYAISGNTLVVKTANGLVKATKDDVEPVLSDGVMKEGNAFGMAVTQAKKDGKKEFEFNGKTYKVKKGSIEENEKETISESDCGCGSSIKEIKLNPYSSYKFDNKVFTYHGTNKVGSHIFRSGSVSVVLDDDSLKTKKIVSINEAVKEPEVIAKIRGIVKNHQHASIKDPKLGKPVKVDAFSASAIIQVYDAINDTNKAKFAAMSIHQMATVAYKLMKK